MTAYPPSHAVRRHRAIASLPLLLLVLLGLAPSASAAARAPQPPRIRSLDCWPRHCSGLKLTTGAWLQLAADGLGSRSYVLFPVSGGRTRAVLGSRRSARRLLARVPGNAVSGRLRIRVAGRPVSRASGRVTVLRPARPTPPARDTGVFAGDGMWIWQLPLSEGGDLDAIVRRAQATHLRTLFIKAGDGTHAWSQFTPSLVSRLRAAGLRVCGWQYVYGSDPAGEAAVAAQAVAAGADCFVIDAEAEYETRYAQAQRYLQLLRSKVGAGYPLGLSSFPYVDYHSAFPYTVFLGPGGAQANLPQMYWKAIGTSVDQVFAHTWPLNRVYGAGIYPLGQTYDHPTTGDLARFRGLAAAYGSAGLSWWDWQETDPSGWSALAQPAGALQRPASADSWPTVRQGDRGDLVVWVQEHLVGAGYSVAVDGAFGTGTRDAVSRFQSAAGLAATGQVDPATWPALLRSPATQPQW